MEADNKFAKEYVKYINIHGKKPVSVAAFCEHLGEEEEEFYKEYASIHGLEKKIFSRFINTTVQKLENDETYQAYNTREKLLAFYYTLVEELKKERSFVSYYFRVRNIKELPFMKGLQVPVKEYLSHLVNEGVESGEIPNRLSLHKLYADAGYLQLLGTLHFWVNDDSEQLEATDGYIERSVNLTMDVISRNAWDSAFEFGKFMFAQWRK